MIIFTEGPDGAGKSVLAAALAEATGFELKRFSYPRGEAEKKSMFDMYTDLIYANEDYNIIVDRCWYSEMIYGPLMRGGSAISTEQMYELEKMVMNHGGGMIVHCSAPTEVLLERVNSRGDDYVPINGPFIELLKQRYETLLNETLHLVPVMSYEYVKNLPKL